jgi:hypothetical protein
MWALSSKEASMMASPTFAALAIALVPYTTLSISKIIYVYTNTTTPNPPHAESGVEKDAASGQML